MDTNRTKRSSLFLGFHPFYLQFRILSLGFSKGSLPSILAETPQLRFRPAGDEEPYFFRLLKLQGHSFFTCHVDISSQFLVNITISDVNDFKTQTFMNPGSHPPILVLSSCLIPRNSSSSFPSSTNGKAPLRDHNCATNDFFMEKSMMF